MIKEIPVPVLPLCLLEPVWVEFDTIIGSDRPELDPSHPLGCHRRRVPDRVVFTHVIESLVHGSGYERIATPHMLRSHDSPPVERLGHRRGSPSAA